MSRCDVYINIVGTFSASHRPQGHQSSVATSIGRLVKHLAGTTATTQHQLVADDYFFGRCISRSTCGICGSPAFLGRTLGGDVGFVGRIRSSTSLPQVGHVRTPSGVVRQMDQGDSERRHRELDKFRRRHGPSVHGRPLQGPL